MKFQIFKSHTAWRIKRNSRSSANRSLTVAALIVCTTALIDFASPVAVANAAESTLHSPRQESRASALQAWRRIRSLPRERIDDTLGFMIGESGDMARLASLIEASEFDRKFASADPHQTVALLRCLYLSASIDGNVPNLLMETVDRVLDGESAPSVRAEAAHRLQIAALSHIAARRDWSAALLPEEIERLTSFLACHGASPRAIASIKQLAENANRVGGPHDLNQCREWVAASVHRHPFARAIDGDRRAREAIGSPWTPPLRTAGGAMIDWAAYRGAPVAVAFVGAGQSPSEAVLTRLREQVNATEPAPFHLVVVSVRFRHDRVNANTLSNDNARETVVLNRGWREPVLAEFGIRALPTIFVVNRDGLLRRIVQPSDWRVGEEVAKAMVELGGSMENEASTTMPTISREDAPTTSQSAD